MNDWKPSLILFDLGGVLFEFRHVEIFSGMRSTPLSTGEMDDFWMRSSCAERIATGRCTPDEFAADAIEELGLEVSSSQFLSEFSRSLRGFLPLGEELLRSLNGRVRLACFSNTNEVEARRLRSEFEVERHFESCFFSNEIGRRKPKSEAYREVVRALGISESAILFLDDTAACVDGARAIGIRSEIARGPEQARDVLRRIGVLD